MDVDFSAPLFKDVIIRHHNECKVLLSEDTLDWNELVQTLEQYERCRKVLARLNNPPNGARVSEAEQNQISSLTQDYENLKAKAVAGFGRINVRRNAMIQKLNALFGEIFAKRKALVSDSLKVWKQAQKRNLIGLPAFDDNVKSLEDMQQCFHFLTEYTWKGRQTASELSKRLQLNTMFRDQNTDLLAKTVDSAVFTYSKVITAFVQDSLIVSIQPPSLLKKDRNFDTEVRFLLGNSLSLDLSPPEVQVQIVTAEDATGLKRNALSLADALAKKPVGRITGNAQLRCTYDEETMEMSAKFEQIKVTLEFRRNAKGTGKKDDTVANTKYCLLFTSRIFVGAPEDKLDVTVYVVSLPFVVTVHHNQDRDSHATILWDYAFACLDTDAIPEEVTWQDLAMVLKYRFKDFTNTRRELSTSDLRYFADKVGIDVSAGDIGNRLVSRSRVFNEPMIPGKEFSFWKWFYEIMNLVKHRLKAMWDENLIYGFVSKNDCARLLTDHPESTFMVRFSDSTPGCVSLSFKAYPMGDVVNLTPFSTKELEMMPLPERVQTCPSLQNVNFIYPDIPKQQLLQKNRSRAKKLLQVQALPGGRDKAGYVDPVLVMVVNPQPTDSATPAYCPTESPDPSPFSGFEASPSCDLLDEDGVNELMKVLGQASVPPPESNFFTASPPAGAALDQSNMSQPQPVTSASVFEGSTSSMDVELIGRHSGYVYDYQ